MAKSTAVRDTVIKGAIADSTALPVDQKTVVKKGGGLGFYTLDYDRNDHAEVKLAGNIGPFKEGDEVYIYAPHWDLPKELKTPNAGLVVPHFDQIDNSSNTGHGAGNRQCCLTSHAMLVCKLFPDFADAAKAAGFKQPEDYYGKLLAKYGDSTNHDAQTRLLAEHFGIESYWSTTLSPKDTRRSLEADCPLVIGTIYKGSGHIVLLVGDEGEKGWRIHCPYGARAGVQNYFITIGNHAGENDVFSNASMQQIFWDVAVTDQLGNHDSGWGRIITSIKGKSTGLPKGL